MRFTTKTHWISKQFGIDLRRLWRSFIALPKYILDWQTFRKSFSGKMSFMPSLHDRFAAGGNTSSEYFWQDLIVARWIYAASPDRHIDIGSRIDGFVAHVASFRSIEVLDIRPIAREVPGVIFNQADLMSPLTRLKEQFDSVSCLHALEHFGLGRYGDKINPSGHIQALPNIANLLTFNGVLYLSVPIGIPRVEFNANRVFDPQEIVDCCSECDLEFKVLTVIGKTNIHEYTRTDQNAISRLANEHYNLGIFCFVKHN